MKTGLYIVAFLMVAAAAYAGNLARDDSGQAIQSPAYHGGKSTALALPSTVIDLRGDAAYSLYCGAVAYERTMPASDSAKGSYVKTPVPATAWHSGMVNAKTPFLNISGCVGYIKRQ